MLWNEWKVGRRDMGKRSLEPQSSSFPVSAVLRPGAAVALARP